MLDHELHLLNQSYICFCLKLAGQFKEVNRRGVKDWNWYFQLNFGFRISINLLFCTDNWYNLTILTITFLNKLFLFIFIILTWNWCKLFNNINNFLQTDVDGRTLRDELVSAISDAMYLSPAVHSAGTFSRRKNNTFFFHFSHQTKSGIYAEVRSCHAHKFVWPLSANHRCVLWPVDQWECSIFVALNLWAVLSKCQWVNHDIL